MRTTAQVWGLFLCLLPTSRQESAMCAGALPGCSLLRAGQGQTFSVTPGSRPGGGAPGLEKQAHQAQTLRT